MLLRVSCFLLANAFFSLELALRAADLAPTLIINTRTGPLHNATRYAPEPDIPNEVLARCPVGHGSFAIDVDYIPGMPDGVRVVKSTGCLAIDNAVVAALRKWCFYLTPFAR